MTTEQLPDGLQLAINIIREAEWPEGAGGNPLDAVLNEHAQRLTLQHHACDQAQRIADLETKCDTLKRLRDELVDERDKAHGKLLHLAQRVADLERAVVKRREISDDVEAELADECDTLRIVNKKVEAERDELRARLAEIEQQEPVAVIRTWHKSGEQHADMADWCDLVDALPDGEHKLYARPVPAIPAGCGACGDACKSRQSCRLADESPEMIPTTVCALEFRRDQYGLDQRQWAWVLGMQPSHYSEVVAGKRTLPKSAMALAFAYGVPAVALFQRLPNLGAADIDRRLTQMSAAAPEAAR